MSKTKIAAYRRLCRARGSIIELADAVLALCDEVESLQDALAQSRDADDRAHPVPCQDCGGSTPCRCATGEG